MAITVVQPDPLLNVNRLSLKSDLDTPKKRGNPSKVGKSRCDLTKDSDPLRSDLPKNPASPAPMCGVVAAILEVGHQRSALLNQLRYALQSGNDQQALRLAREYCGLSNEKSNRVNPGQH